MDKLNLALTLVQLGRENVDTQLYNLASNILVDYFKSQQK